MHTSQSAYRCISAELLLTWFYFRHRYYYYCYCHLHFLSPPLLFRHFYFMWFVSDQAYIKIFVFPNLFLLPFLPCPSFLPSAWRISWPLVAVLITFFLIEIFVLVLCSEPLELYLHSFLKHADIIIFSYFLSQKINIICVI